MDAGRRRRPCRLRPSLPTLSPPPLPSSPPPSPPPPPPSPLHPCRYRPRLHNPRRHQSCHHPRRRCCRHRPHRRTGAITSAALLVCHGRWYSEASCASRQSLRSPSSCGQAERKLKLHATAQVASGRRKAAGRGRSAAVLEHARTQPSELAAYRVREPRLHARTHPLGVALTHARAAVCCSGQRSPGAAALNRTTQTSAELEGRRVPRDAAPRDAAAEGAAP